ncbi:MAG: hypothetical protein QM706_08270 [Nitrospira sp.]
MKELIRSGMVLFLGFALSNCVSPPNDLRSTNALRDVIIPIDVKHDALTKRTSYTGPNCAEHPADHIVLIRAWITPDAEGTYQVYISDTYTDAQSRNGKGWLLYDRVQDLEGTAFSAEVLSRQVNWCAKNTCQYVEAVGVTISRQYLQDRADRGITLRISGSGGEAIAKISSTYLQAFLKRVPESQSIREPTRVKF